MYNRYVNRVYIYITNLNRLSWCVTWAPQASAKALQARPEPCYAGEYGGFHSAIPLA